MVRMYTSPPKFSQMPSAIRQDVPVYRLRENCYFDETLWLAGAVLETVPEFPVNLAMFPLNKIAYDKVREFLTEYDVKGREWSEKNNRAFVPQLPTFDREWETINGIAKERRLHLVHAAGISAPILGAPLARATVQAVDMTSIPQVPFEDGTAIGKGNTMDKDMSAAAAVRGTVKSANG